ncbi:MAG: DUF669 domain-containing protein [Armatimonadota bacterium]
MSTDYCPNQDSSVEDFDLAQFDGSYDEAPIEEREFEDVPDGKYQVNVENVELTRSQTSGNPMLKWTLKILGPKYAGRLLWRNNVITNDSLKWLKTDLHTCGVTLGKLSELPSRLNDLLDVKLEVTKRTRGESESIYLNRRIVVDDTRAVDESALAPF